MAPGLARGARVARARRAGTPRVFGAAAAAVLLARLLVPAPAHAQEHVAVVPGSLEARPPAGQLSPLQARVDAAAAGSRVEIAAGTYAGDLIVDKPLHLAGTGRPRLLGSGTGSVVRIRAAGVTIEGFDIDGRRGGDLGRDSSGIHVAAPNATVRDCRIVDALFGVYLREANGGRVERTTIRGISGRDPGEKGSGIHVWNTDGFTLADNDMTEVRDGFYIQSSSHGTITRNRVRNMRYGLHYMFSDSNVFEDNLFEGGDAGTALMYSKNIVFRRNRFVHNRGFASVGLLFKACDDVVAEDNLIADNARGVFLEGSYRNVFRRNVVAESDVAIVLYDSSGGNRFEQNLFAANLSPLLLVGKRTDTSFDGNYWSSNDEPDLDGDGRSDRPYRLTNIFDHFRGRLTAADLFAQGLAAGALGVAEQAFPVLEPVQAFDRRPLVAPPVLRDVPAAGVRERRTGAAGVTASLASALGGVMVLARARRPRVRQAVGTEHT